jgi:acyl-CoA synthetase (AMP-forming)/AMP-acid ligase II
MNGPTLDEQALQTNLITRVNVGDMLTRTAWRFGERPAVVDGDRRFTYRELEAWANEVAHALLARGYRRGDRVGILSGNSVELLVTHYACAKIGAGFVPVNLGWRAHEVAYVLDHAKVRGLVLVGDLVEYAKAALALVTGVTEVFIARTPAPVADGTFGALPIVGFDTLRGAKTPPRVYVEDRDPLQYLYTSGTTAAPKGAVGSHLATYLNALSLVIEWRFTAEDRLACMMPMFHTGQLNVFCSPALAAGACMILLPKFDADELLDLIETEKVTFLFGLPMMYMAMLARPDIRARDLRSLRIAAYGMAPMPDAQLRLALEVFGCDFTLLFGQTEMGPITTVFRPEHQLSHTGAVGTQTVNVQTAVMAPDGQLLPQGETGEIVYRSPQVMNGYLDDPEATANAFRHGWFHSGDVGRFDDTGVLWFVDRDKDVIKTGGENVASIEVEKAIYDVEPDVAEVAVVGLPHAYWSEAITAFVVAKPGKEVAPAEVLRKLRGHLDGFKIPKAVLVVPEMPKTSTGKLQKSPLRSAHAKHYDGQEK